MNMKVGDKVRFLNSIGGGIVHSFSKNGLVMVETSDGFEIPSLARELVVVESLESQAQLSRPKPVPAPVAPPQPKAPPAPVVVKETPEGEVLNVYLAFLAEEGKPLGGNYEAYFINESNYYLYYNYMYRQNNSWISRHHGLLEPNTKVFAEEFGKEEINSLERVCIQLIAFKKDKPYKLKNPISVELHIDPVKFYKIHCFVENDFFDEDALLYPVIQGDYPVKELFVSAAALQEAMQQKETPSKRPFPKQVIKKKVENPIVEIDLHINQLLDNTTGMSNADILKHQIDTIHNVLSQYANRKGQKIVFIHGKGEGVLRASIEKELKHKYKNYTFQDASFQEYGFGATLVKIS
jgi:hypothetical protein